MKCIEDGYKLHISQFASSIINNHLIEQLTWMNSKMEELVEISGLGCSKLTISLVNILFKLQTPIFFVEKM